MRKGAIVDVTFKSEFGIVDAALSESCFMICCTMLASRGPQEKAARQCGTVVYLTHMVQRYCRGTYFAAGRHDDSCMRTVFRRACSR
jgi:hypothetical protein